MAILKFWYLFLWDGGHPNLMHQIRPSCLEQHGCIHHANTLTWNQEERINHTHPEKCLFSATAQEWSGSEIKCFTLFFCLFYSFLHQQSNLRPHDICQSFQTLLENTYRNMHTNTLYTGWKICVLNSITFINSVKVPGYQILFHPVFVC